MSENDKPLQPVALITICENLSIAAVTMILFSGMVWGAALTVTFIAVAGR